MKTTQIMQVVEYKPLDEWTLAEVKEHCRKQMSNNACKECPFYPAPIRCKLYDTRPRDWDLSEQTRWTEQDVEDAKTLLRLFPDFVTVKRLITEPFNIEILVIEDTEQPFPNSLHLPVSLFPGLKVDKEIKLQEIADS